MSSVVKETESRIALFEYSSSLEIANSIRQLGFVMMLGDDKTVVAE